MPLYILLDANPDRPSLVPGTFPRSTGADTGSHSLESSSMLSNAPSNACQSTTSHSTVTASVSEESTRHHLYS